VSLWKDLYSNLCMMYYNLAISIQETKNRAILDVIDSLKTEFNVSGSEIISLLISVDKEMVPLEIFSDRHLSGLQALVKYLKENLGYKNVQIASLLNKDTRSIWSAYDKSKSRVKSKYAINESKKLVPISIFQATDSVLEALVVFLRKEKWSNGSIALVLRRSEGTISNLYKRGVNHNGSN